MSGSGLMAVSGSTPTANRVTGGVDEYLTTTDQSGSKSFLQDAQGSVLGITDSTGTVQTQFTYEPFGRVVASGSPSSWRNQFTGREADSGGLYYYRARYYSPALHRFISEDPDAAALAKNLYEYVDSDPILENDPFGEYGNVIRFSPRFETINGQKAVSAIFATVEHTDAQPRRQDVTPLGDQYKGDERGHLIGVQLGGGGGSTNGAWQTRAANQAFGDMEAWVRGWIDSKAWCGCPGAPGIGYYNIATMSIHLAYGDPNNPLRPTAFVYHVDIYNRRTGQRQDSRKMIIQNGR